ncbi:MAG: zinc ABC transporter substrate-binding protein [Nitriliruptoraceae bacterium]|nr:zinc ABC transporter substrate-binding protein [Nitriliruptoraceae bacterium]
MQMRRLRRRTIAFAAGVGLVLAACGAADTDPEPEDDGDAGAEESVDDEADDEEDRVHVVATTSILGDIVSNIVGDSGEVSVLMPPGADPHAYEPSAADAAMLREADLVVANGLLLEENLVSALAAAEEDGVIVLEIADQLDPIDFDWDGPGHAHGDDGHDDHGHDDDDHGHGHDDDDHGHGHDDDDRGHGHDDDDHGHGHDDDDHGHGHDDDDDHGHGHDDDDDHGHGHDDDDHGHSHGDEDPHFWFDPIRTADGVMIIAEAIVDAGATDADALMERAEAYADEIRALDAELEEMFDTIPADNRVLVTNHDALGYLANRYGFEVLGTVIPGASTQAQVDAASFADLIETIEEAGVEVVFAENTDSTVLAEQLASEVVDRSDLEVEVVRIYTDALGEDGSGAETYLGLMRTTAERITDALS